MLFLLSPAKSLDYDTPVPESLPHTRPQFVPQSTALIEVLREKSVQEIASLMALSDTLAALNVALLGAAGLAGSAADLSHRLCPCRGGDPRGSRPDTRARLRGDARRRGKAEGGFHRDFRQEPRFDHASRCQQGAPCRQPAGTGA